MNISGPQLVAMPPSHISGFEMLSLGMIDLSVDGKLMLGDPFRDFAKKGNAFLQLPIGQWPVIATVSTQQDRPRIESISLVFDQALLDIRQRWQSRVIERDGPIDLPASILSPCLQDSDETSQWECLTGHAAIVAKHDFETGMPHPMPEMGWFEMLFESGKDDSWFDHVDRAQEEGAGIASICLPLNGKPLRVFPCHGRAYAWMEHATLPGDGPEAHGELDPLDQEIIVRANPLVAFHIQATQP